VWDAGLRIVAHHYAGYALELLEHLQGNDTWKTNGLIIGSPTFQLSTSSTDNPSPKMGGARILENQIELRPDQVQVLIETTKPIICPIFIPSGNYFTVYQVSQICHATSKQIRAWIRKGELEAFDLPGLGLIIETQELNEFLSERNS
jgi:hypothetical protein